MFTMEAFRRSRSSSALGKSDKSDIPDAPDDIDTNITAEGTNTTDMVIEPEAMMVETDASQSVTLNSSVGDNEQKAVEIVKEDFDINISENTEKYLAVTKPNNKDRARSEEPSKKRKLSIESSYSRISLSKLALMDKLKNAKDKLKIPKLLKRAKSDVQESRKPNIKKVEAKRTPYHVASEPVYIHIPLKPPPGETDEYSKYEFESAGPASHSGSLTHLPHFGSGKRKLSLLGLLTELKRVHDQQVLASESKQSPSSDGRTSRRIRLTGSSSRTSLNELKTTEEISDNLVNNTNDTSTEIPTDNSAEEIKEIVLEAAAATAPDAYSVSSDISQYLDKDDKYEIIATEIPNLDIDCVIITEYDEPSTAITSCTSNTNELPEWTRLTPDKDLLHKVRAKSEEPKRKRKSSIDSSYSRKSLSKLAFMKKIKDAKDSIKLPKFLSFTKADVKFSKNIPIQEKVREIPKKKDIKMPDHRKPASPLYIHIPLKLPKGQKDEFSHLSDTAIDTTQDAANESVEETPECETPISPDTPVNGIQLIILTPPSDDEILESNVPETPSESDQKFFESLKVDDLKCIAKKAVDAIYPDNRQLESVVEDDKNEEDAQQGVVTEGETTYWQMHPVLVDVEDGLKLSDAAIALINEEMAKELNAEKQEPKFNIKAETTPQLKKKVSFKRSRAQDGERIYEDVGVSNTGPSQPFRSMSADEAKCYLDGNVIKTTSLDDDYDKWSKITDHEYEPVNPPPEDMKLAESAAAKPNLTVNTTIQQPKHITFTETLNDDTNSENFVEASNAQEFQTEIEDRFFKGPKLTPPKPDTNVHKQESMEEETPPTKSETKKKDKPTNKRAIGHNFNESLRTQADKIKIKFQGIKKPHIHLPQAPKFSTAAFSKIHFKKPNFTVPKMPEIPSIKLASFSLPRKDNSKNSWRKRQYSTESNAGDSKTKKFDFRTYPRIFDKSKNAKQKSIDDSFEKTAPPVEFATVPRVGRSKPKDHEFEYVETENGKQPKEYYYDKSRGLVTIPIDPDIDNALHTQSHIRYNQDYNMDDGFEAEFDDSEMNRIPPNVVAALTEWHKIDANPKVVHGDHDEIQSDRSSGSASEHRQGVLEEIDSDQFFLREKGISQDDIDVGKYLSSEIKEAFRNPINALTQMQSEDHEYDIDVTDQSQSSEEIPKRKWLKKPKRKKTPHVSKEQLSFEGASDPENYVVKYIEPITPAPSRPKRRSKKEKKKKSESKEIIPYQETIPFEEPSMEPFVFIDDEGLLPYEPEEYIESSDTYKNESDIKDEEFKIAVPLYMNTKHDAFDVSPVYINTPPDSEVTPDLLQPTRPLRKDKNLKILNGFGADSNMDQNIVVEKGMPDFEVTNPAAIIEIQNIPPSRPIRKRSHTRSASVTSINEQETTTSDMPPIRPLRFRSRTRSESFPSLQDNEAVMSHGPPARPTRRRSRTRSPSTESFHDEGAPDLNFILDNTTQTFCVEEPCIQVVCDRMGYAIVDKGKMRDPPLPPSRFPKTPPRTRRKRTPVKDGKFATVPRPPERPLRNYSTLGTPTSISRSNGNIFDDEKENVDINPYIEIDEDEIARRLQSGEVVQKMRERPLPAPPRPPRKARTPNREILRDISHERNLPSNNDLLDPKHQNNQREVDLFELEQQILTNDHEETITHGALVVQPIDNSTVLAHSEFYNSQREPSQSSSERIIFIEREPTVTDLQDQKSSTIEDIIFSDRILEEPNFEQIERGNADRVQLAQDEEEDSDEEISKVPEEFHRYKEPDTEVNNHIVSNLNLQQLEIDKLNVNEQTANKIVVSDLEGVSMQVSEINSKSGNLVISGIDIPPNVIQEMLLRLGPQQDSGGGVTLVGEQQASDIRLEQPEEQVTSFAIDESEPPPVPPRSDSVGDLLDSALLDTKPQPEIIDQDADVPPEIPDKKLISGQKILNIAKNPPVRPPRRPSQTEKLTKDFETDDADGLQQRTFDIIENEYVTNEGDIIEQISLTPLEASSILDHLDSNHTQVPSSLPSQEHVLLDSLCGNTRRDRHSFTNSINQPLSHDTLYLASQPPLSFYNLRPSLQDNFNENNIPLLQCRMCRHKLSTLSRSSSSDDLTPKHHPPRRLSEPSIPHLTGQLVQSCATELDRSFRNLVTYVSDSVFCSAEGKRDIQVLLLMLLVLIAVLILVSSEGRVAEHHHHWEYFNPPKDA